LTQLERLRGLWSTTTPALDGASVPTEVRV
jgi:hypothetical protein